MRERLIQYVDLLFAGAENAEDIKQEILQNTLDRYDDLISLGKSEESAYRLAISGIGDINEILDSANETAQQAHNPQQENIIIQNRKMRAVAIAMYICSAIPLFILGDLGFGSLGLCMTILLVGAATYLMLLTRKPGEHRPKANAPQDPRKKALSKLVNIITVILYLIISFATQAWFITWLIFPISGCVEGLVDAIIDMKEAYKNED